MKYLLQSTIICFLIPSFSLSSRAQNYPERINFNIQENAHNITFNAILENDVQINVSLPHLSDWEGKGELMSVLQTAISQMKNLQDSFTNPLNTKVLNIYQPINSEMLAIQIKQEENKNLDLILRGNQYYSLKTKSDTVRIIKDIDLSAKMKEEDSEEKSQKQYVFILNNLEEINSASVLESVKKVELQLDSIHSVYLQKWKRPQQTAKKLDVVLKGDSVVIHRPNQFFKCLSPDVSFGIEAFNGQFSTTIDIGLAYVWNKYQEKSMYAKLNLTTYTFPQIKLSESSSYSSLDFEIGGANTTQGFLSNKAAIGFGYFFGSHGYQNRFELTDMTRLYLIYPITNKLNIGLDIMTNWKISKAAKEEGRAKGVWGIFIKYSFL